MMSTPSAYTSLICADAAGEYCASSHLVMMDVKRCDSSADTPRLCSYSRTFSLVRLATGMLNLSPMYPHRARSISS